MIDTSTEHYLLFIIGLDLATPTPMRPLKTYITAENMITRNPSSQIFITMNHCKFLTHLYFSLLAKQPMVS